MQAEEPARELCYAKGCQPWSNACLFLLSPSAACFTKLMCCDAQLLALSIFIFGLACVGVFYPYNRGGLYTALIVLYALTAGIAGYVAGSYYKQMAGRAWVRNILLTSVTFCGPLFVVFCINNTVAISYRVRDHIVLGPPSSIFITSLCRLEQPDHECITTIPV